MIVLENEQEDCFEKKLWKRALQKNFGIGTGIKVRLKAGEKSKAFPLKSKGFHERKEKRIAGDEVKK